MHRSVRLAFGALVAALFTVLLSPGAAHAVPQNASWFSGTVAAGASQNWTWNNANPLDAAFLVGLSPQGASTSAACRFQVTSTSYVQQPGGEREFHFTIKNIGTVACGTNILITSLPNSVGAWSTGGVAPGSSVTKHWNNANPLTNSYLVGVTPLGATSTTPCQFSVTHTWYEQQPTGERELWFTVKNTGSIACSANLLVAAKPSAKINSMAAVAPGASRTSHWNNAIPLTDAYVLGLSPLGAPGSLCKLEVTRTYYQQVINPPAEREFWYTVTNTGSVTCSVDVLLGAVAS